uniref:Uncharacterized protein n=1 Tax=Oryza punctata TaxID=4537 RepID=A0A0E0L223_ORYPU
MDVGRSRSSPLCTFLADRSITAPPQLTGDEREVDALMGLHTHVVPIQCYPGTTLPRRRRCGPLRALGGPTGGGSLSSSRKPRASLATTRPPPYSSLDDDDDGSAGDLCDGAPRGDIREQHRVGLGC